MAVSIRLSRFGRLHRPLFRVVAIDKRRHREGESTEIIGAYDPLKKDKNLELDATKVESWVNRGAQISGGLKSLMKKYGYAVPAAKKTAAVAAAPKAKAAASKTAAKPAATPKKTYVAPSRRALNQHAAKLKAARKAAAAAAAPAAPAAEPAKA